MEDLSRTPSPDPSPEPVIVPQSSRPCPTCRTTNSEWQLAGGSHFSPINKSLRDIRRGKSEGCQVCSVLFDGIMLYEPVWAPKWRELSGLDDLDVGEEVSEDKCSTWIERGKQRGVYVGIFKDRAKGAMAPYRWELYDLEFYSSLGRRFSSFVVINFTSFLCMVICD
jgi:hypothetical protein